MDNKQKVGIAIGLGAVFAGVIALAKKKSPKAESALDWANAVLSPTMSPEEIDQAVSEATNAGLVVPVEVIAPGIAEGKTAEELAQLYPELTVVITGVTSQFADAFFNQFQKAGGVLPSLRVIKIMASPVRYDGSQWLVELTIKNTANTAQVRDIRVGSAPGPIYQEFFYNRVTGSLIDSVSLQPGEETKLYFVQFANMPGMFTVASDFQYITLVSQTGLVPSSPAPQTEIQKRILDDQAFASWFQSLLSI
jgi:hypothetical protein